MPGQSPDITSLYHPRYWPSWLAIGLLRVIATLPFRAKLVAGKYLGLLAMRLGRMRRHVVETNIRLCFPELDTAQQAALVREVFIQNGIGVFEIAWAWWAKDKDLEGRYRVEGLEHLQAASKDGKGVVLVGAHFVHLDLCGRMLNQVTPMDVIYRRNNNPVFEHVITTGRKRVFGNVLERRDMRTIVRKLREGRVIWYSPDQDFRGRQSVFAPFFGVSASTLTTTAQLARMGRANICCGFHYRDPVAHQYRIVFKPVPDHFPTGDDVADATLINRLIESGIREQPEQYMWIHRRFKTRPEGEPSLY
ncbi:MAG: LpxL/LpxP family Kdo(2)-lipid IV(A) lauroyl/palmitoleoyl acyltransferase [Halieaceae bacterium]|jgi:KDO2-lipid IV(A) lauroyltransferase|nr:LpxL/LpxP family Kdo(2)-lipid IV(A) lauroyl/palmitoleoyl acyltransferase [Halieaceae bacterium]